jgi:hypothetical protein
MDLGVIDGRDVVAVPETSGGGLDEPGQGAGDRVGVPGADFGEGLHRLPVGRTIEGHDRLGNGVLLDVEGHGGDPFDEAAESGACEGRGEGPQQGLPDRPEELSVRHGASPRGAGWEGDYPSGSAWEMPRSIGDNGSVGVAFFRETTA